jgi:hypothetical protein
VIDFEEAVTRGREQITFCDALEQAGLGQIAHRSRFIARLLLEACDELSAERSHRVAMQAQRDRCLEILARQAAEAAAGQTIHPPHEPFLESE